MAVLACASLGAQAQTSMTTIAGSSQGGQYIGNAGSYASPLPQSFDFPGSRPYLSCYCTADDRYTGIADYGAVGFSYVVSAGNAPGNNFYAGAFYRGGFRDYFSVSGPAAGSWVDIDVHVTLRAAIAVSLDSINGQPYAGPAAYTGLGFSDTTLSADADGHTLTVSPEQPEASIDYTLRVLVGDSYNSLSGGFANVQPGVGVDYFVPVVLGVSASWDLLPAHGNGLLYTVTSAPGVTLTFASGHIYSPVPEPSGLWLMGCGVAALAARHRRARGTMRAGG